MLKYKKKKLYVITKEYFQQKVELKYLGVIKTRQSCVNNLNHALCLRYTLVGR